MNDRKQILTETHIGSEVPWDVALPFIIRRLERKLNKIDGGCWEYIGFCNTWGYGNIDVRRQGWMAHRLAYTIWKGPIPEGHDVLHRCDNPPCCNPDHLWTGTQRENSLDMVAKGRTDAQKRTHCTRGHDYSVHGVRHGKNQWRMCSICARGRMRIAAGWPEELAYTADVVPHGYRPINGKFRRRKSPTTRSQPGAQA